MIRIIYVVTKGRWGGAQRYIYDLTTNLPPKRFNPLVVTGEGEQLAERLMVSGVACRQLTWLGRDIKFFNDFAVGWELYRLFKTERPNIIHLNSSKVGLVGALAGRLARVPKIIFTAHGWAFNEDRPWLARVAIKILSWLTVLLADQTIVVAESEKKLTRRWLGTKNKIITVHNGVRESVRLDRSAGRKQLKLADDQFVIGTIAELTKNKGLVYLIQAFALLRVPLANRQGEPLTLVVIGEGEDRPDLSKLINQLQLTERVLLVGHIAEAANLLSAFDIFALPSIKEGLPYVLLEAGLASLPVVASAVGGIPEIVTSMESGILIKLRQPSEIAKAIQFLIEQPEKRRKFGSRLRQKIRREFSTARMVKQTLAVYNEVNETTS